LLLKLPFIVEILLTSFFSIIDFVVFLLVFVFFDAMLPLSKEKFGGVYALMVFFCMMV
jgi:NhaP-type Na+/H+ or K+/H+ antiporter